MKKVYRNYFFLLLIVFQCGWIIVANNPEETIEKGIVNEKEKDKGKDKDKKEKTDPKSNRRNKKSRRLTANVSTISLKNVMLPDVAEKSFPAIVAPPAPRYEANMPQEENEYYQFNSVANSFQPTENELAKMGFDPVRFTLRADKDTIEVNKEFEIKIIAEYLDVSPNLMFQFDGSNEYTLKMLMPKGFIFTGGTYYDFIEDRVSKDNPRKELTVKGFFESKTDNMCFSLLRSFKGASVNDVWIKKGTICMDGKKPELKEVNSNDENSRVQVDCNVNIFDLNFNDIGIGDNKAPPGWQKEQTIDGWDCGTQQSGSYGRVPYANADASGRVVGFWVGSHLEAIKKTFYFEGGKSYYIQFAQGTSMLKSSSHPAYFQVIVRIPNGAAISAQGSPKMYSANTPFHEVKNLKSFTISVSGDYEVWIGGLVENESGQRDQAYLFLDNFKIFSNSNTSIPQISANPTEVPKGEYSILYATGCQSYVQWQIVSPTKGNDVVDQSGQPWSLRIDSTAHYRARCVNSSDCKSDWSAPIPIYMSACSPPDAPTITSTNREVPYGGSTIQLEATCQGNLLPVWPNGSSSTTFSAAPGTYTVKCIKYSSCESSTEVVVTQGECPALTKPTLSAEVPQVTSKRDVKLTATGCTNGSVVYWEGDTGSQTSKIVYVETTTTYRAYCKLNECKSSWGEVKVEYDDNGGCEVIPSRPSINESSPVLIPSGHQVVTLTSSSSCPSPYKLVWSNGATATSISAGVDTYSVTCKKDDKCKTAPSEEVKVRSCTPPSPPVLTSNPPFFNNGGGPATLSSSNCAGNVLWDHYMGVGKEKNVTVSTTTTYKAICIVAECESAEGSVTVEVNCNGATTPFISIVSSTASNTTLQATNCSGLIVWNNDPNQTGTTKVTSDGGNYYATCRVGTCESAKSNTLYLGGKCGEYNVWAYSNANANPGSVTIGDNLVLNSGVTGRPDSDYYFAWYYNGTKISGENSAPSWTVTNASNSGIYTVHVRRLGTETVCTTSFNVNISPCNLHAGASWRQDGSNLVFSIWSDKDLASATINWILPSGPPKSDQSFSVPAEDIYRGNYSLSITLRGCTVNSYLTNINFDAIPNYDGAVEYAWCDFVKGRVEDKANSTKNVEVKLFIDGIEAGYQVASNRRFSFVYPVAKKDGNAHNVEVRYYTPGNAKNNTVLDIVRSVTCCQLEFANVATPIATECDVLYNKGKATVAFVRTTANSTVSYRLLKKFYNEAQQVYYEPVGDWKLVATNGTINSTVEVNNLEDGHYKIELREGTTNPCYINGIFTIDCMPLIAGCKLPNIIITPGDTIREGIGIVPTLYADFVGTSGLINTNPNNNNGLGDGYFLNGNSEINLTAIDDKRTFTFEAWIRPEPTSFTTVGLIGGGEKHRFLIQSLYNTGTRFKLSAGANGLTLIEELQEGTNYYRRVALSYENAIIGLNHIALVYQDDLPKLYLNGNLVATATQTIQAKYTLSPSDANYVLAGRQLGFHSNMGFIGHIDEIRGWTSARSQTDIQSKKDSKRDNTVINSADIQGYWTFNTGDGLKNLKYTAEFAKSEGAALATLDSLPTYNVPNLTWYVGTKQVGTGLKHVMADSMIRADGVTYTVKYTGANGVACQTEKTVTIKRATQNTLSGCFFISPNYETTRKVHFAIDGGTPKLLNTRVSVGEDGIWEFEHDANGIYRVILPYNEQLVTNGVNSVQLAARVTNQQNQLWKFKFIDSLSQNPTIKLQSISNNQFLTSTSNTAYLSLSADGGPTANSQIFKLEKTTCPVKPKACTNDGQITIEKITGVSAATATYLEQNDDLISAYVGKFRGNGKTINKWGNTTTRINFTNSIPANDVRTDNFVVRLTGYFCAPGTGEFEFGLVGVDKSQLFVSPSEDERTKERLIKNTSTIGWDTWTDANRAKYYMTQNRTYYVEATMLVNAATSEHLKLGIAGPGITDDGSDDQGVFLQHFNSSPRDKKPARIRDDSEACGKVPAGPLVSDDLPFLIKGDTIFAGDFKVIVDAVTGANGTFSGTGTAKVKYMFDTPIKVRFDGVQVNDYYDLVSGEITTEYDKEWSNVVDVDTLIKDVMDGIKSFADGADKLCKFNSDKYSGKALSSMEKSFFDAAAKEIDDALASQYRDLYTSMQTQMDIIDANRAACRAIPPNQTACTNINNAKSALTTLQANVCSLETQRSGDITNVVEVIRLALDKIKTLATYNSTDAIVSTLLTAKNTKMTALGLNATGPDEGSVESNLPNALISEFKIDEPITDSGVLEYIDAEIKYNQAKLTNLYVTAFNNAGDRKAIGEKLSKNAVTLTKYIIDRKKANATNDAIALEIVPVILNETKDILEQKVYEK